MTKIYLGKFVSTHGINGELKLLSDFERKDLVYKKGFCLYVNEIKYTITSNRSHKQYELIRLNDYTNINEVLFLVGQNVFIDSDDLKLTEDEYLLEELIGAEVIDDDKLIGVVTDLYCSKNVTYVKINDTFLIPLIDVYIKYYDKKNKKLYTTNAQSLDLN